jgi:hypothetical protein
MICSPECANDSQEFACNVVHRVSLHVHPDSRSIFPSQAKVKRLRVPPLLFKEISSSVEILGKYVREGGFAEEFCGICAEDLSHRPTGKEC